MLALKSSLSMFMCFISFGLTPCYAGKWECFDSFNGQCVSSRYQVPGGWFITVVGHDNAPIGSFFYPDKKHKWKVK